MYLMRRFFGDSRSTAKKKDPQALPVGVLQQGVSKINSRHPLAKGRPLSPRRHDDSRSVGKGEGGTVEKGGENGIFAAGLQHQGIGGKDGADPFVWGEGIRDGFFFCKVIYANPANCEGLVFFIHISFHSFCQNILTILHPCAIISIMKNSVLIRIDPLRKAGSKKGFVMAKNNAKMVEQITSMDVDFAQWYTDVVKKAELVDYSGVKGCMIIRPYGYAIWENIQKDLDARFKELGHENVYMPMFIPESLLQKEKDHVEGFAPECAIVTMGGGTKLSERLIVRPTSETLFCEHFRNIIQSYRDLPKLYNQWCNVVRWEKTTRPFLRTSEFLWQEGHTMHETEEEAREETLRMLKVYEDFYAESLAIPAYTGRKTEKEKFAGAEETYTIEPMMHNGVALQGGTTHYFGDGFAKAFDIMFTGRDNTQKYPHQTSWGVSTRMIGAIIMTHGDDNGLILPPAIAPIQLAIIPVAQHKEGVLEKANEIKSQLSKQFRVKLDDSDNSTGWKFSQYEMKGVPLRLEIGPRDIENNSCVLVSRVTREKTFVSLDNLAEEVEKALKKVHDELYQRALENRTNRTYEARSYEEMLDIAANKSGYVKAMWCGETECEEKIKEETGGVKSRCIPFVQEQLSDVCVCCGKPAKHMVIWGRQY